MADKEMEYDYAPTAKPYVLDILSNNKANITKIYNAISDLMSDVSALNTDVTNIKSDINDINKDISDEQSSSEIATLKTKVDAISSAIDKNKEDIYNNTSNIVKNNNAITNVKDDIKTLSNEVYANVVYKKDGTIADTSVSNIKANKQAIDDIKNSISSIVSNMENDMLIHYKHSIELSDKEIISPMYSFYDKSFITVNADDNSVNSISYYTNWNETDDNGVYIEYLNEDKCYDNDIHSEEYLSSSCLLPTDVSITFGDEHLSYDVIGKYMFNEKGKSAILFEQNYNFNTTEHDRYIVPVEYESLSSGNVVTKTYNKTIDTLSVANDNCRITSINKNGYAGATKNIILLTDDELKSSDAVVYSYVNQNEYEISLYNDIIKAFQPNDNYFVASTVSPLDSTNKLVNPLDENLKVNFYDVQISKRNVHYAVSNNGKYVVARYSHIDSGEVKDTYKIYDTTKSDFKGMLELPNTSIVNEIDDTGISVLSKLNDENTLFVPLSDASFGNTDVFSDYFYVDIETEYNEFVIREYFVPSTKYVLGEATSYMNSYMYAVNEYNMIEEPFTKVVPEIQLIYKGNPYTFEFNKNKLDTAVLVITDKEAYKTYTITCTISPVAIADSDIIVSDGDIDYVLSSYDKITSFTIVENPYIEFISSYTMPDESKFENYDIADESSYSYLTLYDSMYMGVKDSEITSDIYEFNDNDAYIVKSDNTYIIVKRTGGVIEINTPDADAVNYIQSKYNQVVSIAKEFVNSHVINSTDYTNIINTNKFTYSIMMNDKSYDIVHKISDESEFRFTDDVLLADSNTMVVYGLYNSITEESIRMYGGYITFIDYKTYDDIVTNRFESNMITSGNLLPETIHYYDDYTDVEIKTISDVVPSMNIRYNLSNTLIDNETYYTPMMTAISGMNYRESFLNSGLGEKILYNSFDLLNVLSDSEELYVKYTMYSSNDKLIYPDIMVYNLSDEESDDNTISDYDATDKAPTKTYTTRHIEMSGNMAVDDRFIYVLSKCDDLNGYRDAIVPIRIADGKVFSRYFIPYTENAKYWNNPEVVYNECERIGIFIAPVSENNNQLHLLSKITGKNENKEVVESEYVIYRLPFSLVVQEKRYIDNIIDMLSK